MSADYQFVYYDGLNRFYVADEHIDLQESFAIPPNVFDYFIDNNLIDANQEISRHASALQTIQQELGSARKESDALRAELDWARTDLGYLRTEIGRMREEKDTIQAELATQRSIKNELDRAHTELSDSLIELEAKRLEAENFKKEYLNIYGSLSYRVTAPLRALYPLLEKLRAPFRKKSGQSIQSDWVVTSMMQDSSSIYPDISEDEKHFLDLFQRKFSNRKNREL